MLNIPNICAGDISGIKYRAFELPDEGKMSGKIVRGTAQEKITDFATFEADWPCYK